MKHIQFIILLLITTVSFSQEIPQALNLQEAIDYALQNNRVAKNAQRDIEAAKQQKWETIASGLPQISASIDYNNWLKQQVSLIPAEFFGGNPGEFAEVTFGTKQTMNATATLKQKAGTKGSLQKDIEYLGTLTGADRTAALGKLGYKAPSLSAAIKELKITGQAPDPATIINLATLYIGPDFQGIVDVTEEMSGKPAGTYITNDATALVIIDEQGNTRLQKL